MKVSFKFVRLSGILVALIISTGCFAQQPPLVQPLLRVQGQDTVSNGNASRNNFIEIDRLIVDETMSKAGYDFLELFQAKWIWPPALDDPFQIVVTERPFRGITTQVIITLNDLVVFESFLQTRYDVLESLSEAAVEQTFAYLMNYESIMQQLAGDDVAGNGIY